MNAPVPSLPAFSRQSLPAAVRNRGFWAAVAASLLATGLIGWLHFQQRHDFEREAGQQRHVRQARVELNRGFRIAVLASDPATPYNGDEGVALIRQSIVEFAATLQDVAPAVEQTVGDFRRRADDLLQALAQWRADPSLANATALRVAFGRLDRQTALLDAENERQLRELSASQARVFLLTLTGAGVLLAASLVTIFRAFRITTRAEKEREASDQLFRELFERVPVAMGLLDSHGVISMVNESFTRLFGYALGEIPDIPTWWQKAFPDAALRREAKEKWETAVATAVQSGASIPTAEYQVTCKDGAMRAVEISGIVVAGGVLAVFRDITARQQAEQRDAAARAEREQLLAEAENSRQILLSVVEDQKAAEVALREREARYRSLVETSFDWVWEVDTQGRYTYASPRIRDLLGYLPEDVIGRTPFDLMPEPEAKRVSALFAEFTASRKPVVALENVNRHKEGRLVVVETNGVPVFAPDGTWLGYQGMDRDITQRRAAEQMLRLRGAALEAAANAIVITSRDGAIEWANPAFTALSGWQLHEAVGRNPRELVKSGEHDAAFYRHLWETILAGKVWRGEITNRRKDGKLRTEDMTITPLADEQGRIQHFIAIKQDITERKTMEAQGRHAQRMEAIGTLAGGIAHDLNNILAPILIVSGLLKERVASDKDQEMLGMLQQGAQRGSDIVRQLLAFSRGVEGEHIAVQPKHLVREIMAIMRETFPREIDLRADMPTNLGTVRADPTQLHQVLLNLCVNARDAMPEGGHLTLKAANLTLAADAPELAPGLAPGAFVVIEVGDTGHGIPPDIRHRIFDPFFTTKPIGKGTGLGLSTVQGIVRSHGGFVTVESQIDRGTTFRVYLPSIEAVAPAAPAVVESSPHTVTGKTILVVDDERDVREAFRMVLQAHGYTVVIAVNGKDALAQFQRNRGAIHLVLTDVMMPVMGGVALVKALRELQPGLPVLAASGMSEAEQGMELTKLGVTRVLAKPCPADKLLAAVAESLAGKK